DADHAEGRELGGAQRAHAGAAEHGDAAGQGPQDLLVPYRGNLVEVAVDDADHARRVRLDQAVDVALADRRQYHGVDCRGHGGDVDGRPGEDRDIHNGRSATAARARSPGT